MFSFLSLFMWILVVKAAQEALTDMPPRSEEVIIMSYSHCTVCRWILYTLGFV